MSNDNESTLNKASASFPTFRKLVSPRVLKGYGICIVALITLISLFYAIENWRGAREWNRVRTMLLEKGEPLSFADLVPTLPADDENFAMSPYFKGALDKSIDPETGEERWRGWLQAVTTNRQPDLNPIGLDIEGTWRLGESARVVWREWELASVVRDLGMQINTNEPFGVLSQFVSLAEADMLQIKEGVQRPHSQFPVHYEDNVSALLPHLSKIKRLSRLFTFRALVALHDGESQTALDDLVTALKLGESIKVEPILISQLVRQAVVSSYAVQVVWEGLANRVWTEAQLAELQAQLEQIDLLAGYQNGMRGERIFGTDLTDIAERERNLSDYGDAIGTSTMSGEVARRLVDYAPRGWYLHNKAFIARLHTEVSIESVDPAAHRVFLDRVPEYEDRLTEALEDDRKLFIARIVMPAVGKAAGRAAESQVSVDLAIVACALERYRLSNGDYPEALTALAPKFLSSVPIDVVDGKPLGYRKTDNAFVLYSIGGNQTDDGGVPGFKEKPNERIWLRDEGDWAWGYSPEDLGLN